MKNYNKNCHVPNCKKTYKKDESLTFHEVPANLEMMNRWHDIVWTSNGYEVPNISIHRVCSRHFKPEDYKQTPGPRRTLLRSSVPSLFLPNSHSSSAGKPVDTSWEIQTIKMEVVDSDGITIPQESDNSLPRLGMVAEIVSLDQSIDSGCTSVVSTSNTSRDTNANHYIAIDSSICKQVQHSLSTSSKTHLGPPATRSAATQVDNYRSQILDRKPIQALKRKVTQLKTKIAKYETKVKKLEEEIKECNCFVLDKVKKAAASGSHKAIFLMDLFNNFGTRHKWSDSTINQCSLWRSVSTKGYDHVRKAQLLDIPCRTRLNARSRVFMTNSMKLCLEAEDYLEQPPSQDLPQLSNHNSELLSEPDIAQPPNEDVALLPNQDLTQLASQELVQLPNQDLVQLPIEFLAQLPGKDLMQQSIQNSIVPQNNELSITGNQKPALLSAPSVQQLTENVIQMHNNKVKEPVQMPFNVQKHTKIVRKIPNATSTKQLPKLAKMSPVQTKQSTKMLKILPRINMKDSIHATILPSKSKPKIKSNIMSNQIKKSPKQAKNPLNQIKKRSIQTKKLPTKANMLFLKSRHLHNNAKSLLKNNPSIQVKQQESFEVPGLYRVDK